MVTVKRVSAQSYLENERVSPVKHEWYDGEVVAMSGASKAHNLIVSNLIVEMGIQLRQGSCQIYPSDMRVYMPYANAYVYPDVTVVCDEPIFMEGVFDTLLNPQVIFEVLSPSTAQHDQTHKLNGYRGIASLNEYVLVETDTPHVVHYARQAGAMGWSVMDFIGLDSVLQLRSIGVNLLLRDVYRLVGLKGASS